MLCISFFKPSHIAIRVSLCLSFDSFVSLSLSFDSFVSSRYYKIVSSPENYSAILSKIRDEGINFVPDNGFELLPVTPIEV